MRRTSALVTVILLFATIAGCAEKQPTAPVSETRVLLDTYCTMTIYGAHEPALLDEAFKLCAQYEALFGITVEGGDVWRINHAMGTPVSVAPQTAEVIRAGMVYGGISDGMFDITVGRLSALWDFSGSAYVPSEAELGAVLASIDYRQVTVTEDTVQLADPEAWIDLGAIAKGYIADMLAGFLKENGVSGAVIDLGGDVAIIGEKPDGSPWYIGVRQPFGGRSDLLGIIETGGASVTTSGVYERQFVENGIIYHHILDPYTGMPVRSDIIGATIVTESSMTGDALSTIALLAGSERAAGLLEQAHGFIGALLILENGELMRIGDINFQEIN